MSQVLRDARRYEEEKERGILPEERPAFHLSSRVGWMNDPNGFSYHDGHYHLFYQYNPYHSHWDTMHWGHAVSKDLLHWEYLPAALAPDCHYDRDGCFSGSALTMPDGRMLIVYTGVVSENLNPGGPRLIQTQNIALGDGLDFSKYEGNPVLAEADLPEGGSPYDFRDPRIWQSADGSYRLAVANDVEGHGGQILLFESEDAFDWNYRGCLADNRNRFGKMWECPDFFGLDGKHVLLVSAQDMLPEGLEYHNGNGTFYIIGNYDPETDLFSEESNHAADYGIDFYAPQTVLTPDGRRVMIAWMQNWDTCNRHRSSIPWFGQMCIPRELSVKDGILYQQPIRELSEYRKDSVFYENLLIRDREIRLEGISGRLLDLEVELEAEDPDLLYRKFEIRFAADNIYHTSFSYRPDEKIAKIDRKFSGSRRAIIHQRRALAGDGSGRLKFRLILDRFSVEVFINDGQKVMTATIYTDMSAEGISFIADGSVRISVSGYRLDF